MASDPRAILQQFLTALEAKDEASVAALVADDVARIEHPNRFCPPGRRQTKPDLIDGLRKGAGLLASERYEIEDCVVDGDRIAARLTWEAALAIPIGDQKAGDRLTADLALFVTVRDDRIVEIHNYDCFHP